MPHDDALPPATTVPDPPAETPLGVVYDVDGVLRIAHLRRQLGRVRALLTRSPHDRRSPLGMPHLLQTLADSEPEAAVFYLTAVPSRLARPLKGFLHRDGYPSGTPLMSGGALVSGWLLGSGLARKRTTLARLAELHPQLRWVLVGDDAGHDPQLFTDFTRCHPGQVAVIALRQVDVGRANSKQAPLGEQVSGVTVVTAPNGEEMLPRLRASLGLDQPRRTAVDDWFLTTSERRNDATRLRAWTTGNAVRSLVHGGIYFSFFDALAATGRGDSVLFAGWRADSDELLTDRGPTVAEALAGAARRGALVCGLLWHAHLSVLGYHVKQNRTLATDVAAAGAEVLLDQQFGLWVVTTRSWS
jgi:hypothetical protein